MTDILYDPIEAIRDAFDTARHIVDIKNKLNLIEDENHQIFLALRRIERKVGLLMPTLEEFNAKLDELDASIDAGAAGVDALEAAITALREELAAGGLSEAEEAAVLARIEELQAKAASVATDAGDNTDEGAVPA